MRSQLLFIGLLLIAAQTAGIPAHGGAVVLFDGANLNQFDTFSPSKGLNNDTDHIFTVENGAIHVSGKEYGGLITKQEYADYYLTAEFKWGEGTYAARAGKARDAGILYDVTGPMQVWPSSVEFQIQEGDTGDIYLCNSFALTNSAGNQGDRPRRASMSESTGLARVRGRMKPDTAIRMAIRRSRTANGIRWSLWCRAIA